MPQAALIHLLPFQTVSCRVAGLHGQREVYHPLCALDPHKGALHTTLSASACCGAGSDTPCLLPFLCALGSWAQLEGSEYPTGNSNVFLGLVCWLPRP